MSALNSRLRLLPWAMVLLALLAQAIGTVSNVENVPSLPKFGSFPSAPRMTLAQPVLNAHGVRALLDGDGDGSLSRQIIAESPQRAPEDPGRARMIVAFAKPEGHVSSYFRIGWPRAAFFRSETVAYADIPSELVAPQQPGASSYGMLPRWKWSSTDVEVWSNALSRSIHFDVIAWSVFVVIVCWYLGSVMGWFLRRKRRRRTGPLAWMSSRAAALCSLLALLGVVAGTAASFRSGQRTYIPVAAPRSADVVWATQDRILAYNGDPYVSFTALDSTALASLTPGPQSDSLIAQSIQDVHPAGASDDQYLIFGFEEETSGDLAWTRVGWPWFFLTVWNTTAQWPHEDGSTTAASFWPRPSRLEWQGGSCTYLPGSDVATPTRRQVSASLPALALNAVCLWLVWMAGRGMLWLWGRRTRARRRRGGQCLNCGYSLVGLGMTP